MILPEGAGVAQREFTRRAFYGGLISGISNVTETVETLSEEEGAAYLEALGAEAQAFAADGEARDREWLAAREATPPGEPRPEAPAGAPPVDARCRLPPPGWWCSRVDVQDPPVVRLDPNSPEARSIEALLKRVFAAVHPLVAPRYGFTLFVFDWKKSGSVSYISTAERKDMIAMILTWLKAQIGEQS